MREIIPIMVGNCGCNIGYSHLQNICDEHGIDPNGMYLGDRDRQLERIETYFDEDIKYSPRAIFIDTEVDAISSLYGKPYFPLLHKHNIIFWESNVRNNYAYGYYSHGSEIINMLLDTVRKQAEKAESLQGFQFFHSIGGGTGSGLCSLLQERLKDEMNDKIYINAAIFPHPSISNIVVEPYNAIFAINKLIDTSNGAISIDNEALMNICKTTFKMPTPTYGDLNHTAISTLCNISASFRFIGTLNDNLRKFSMSMVPFPRMIFLFSHASYLSTRSYSQFRYLVASEHICKQFDDRHSLCRINCNNGIYYTCSLICRGRFIQEDQLTIGNYFTKDCRNKLCTLLPESPLFNYIEISCIGMKRCMNLIGNNTAIRELINKQAETFSAMRKRKAFMHWYTNEGMESSEFDDALLNVSSAMQEYEDYENTAKYK